MQTKANKRNRCKFLPILCGHPLWPSPGIVNWVAAVLMCSCRDAIVVVVVVVVVVRSQSCVCRHYATDQQACLCCSMPCSTTSDVPTCRVSCRQPSSLDT